MDSIKNWGPNGGRASRQAWVDMITTPWSSETHKHSLSVAPHLGYKAKLTLKDDADLVFPAAQNFRLTRRSKMKFFN